MKNKVNNPHDSQEGHLFMSNSSPLLATLTEGFPYCIMSVLVKNTEIIAVLHIIQWNIIKLKIF
jgi:hypothetical protein